MAVINTNVKALYTQHALKGSARAQTVAMEQLSTGKRINSARDDAAGMAIAKRMSQQIRSLDMAIRNAGDAVALIQTAEGATGTITDMLQRMRELAIQAMNDTNAQDQRGYLDLEFQQLKQQIVTISEHTQWNGFSILNGTAGERVGERPVYKVVSASSFFTPDQVTAGLTGLRDGDLVFVQRETGVAPKFIQIPGAKAADDTLSTAGNTSSSIAIAAAINSLTEETGVAAVVNPTSMDGQPMVAGTSALTGTIVINGYSAPIVTTTVGNTYETRLKVVEAINFIADQTGVKAVDTGSDGQGIRLIAQDGRNIQVSFANVTGTGASNTAFAERVGLRDGLQVGSFSLETGVQSPIEIQAAPPNLTGFTGGNINNARLTAGAYTENVSALVTGSRQIVSGANAIKVLRTGDLVINNVAIPGSSADSDSVSNTQSLSSSKAASAIAIAAAINSQTHLTDVTAKPIGATTEGTQATTIGVTTGSTNLYINGIAVNVSLALTPSQTAVDRMSTVLSAINLTSGLHGARATLTDQGALKLTTVDGRNLSVWHDAAVAATELGLGGAQGLSSAAVGDLATFTAANTLYGRVELSSPNQMEIKPGINGFAGNFSSLGLQQGTFGGTVNEADSKMSPPQTGRLTFHVGASATQTIHIDFADYGAKGPITGDITGDVENWNNDSRVNRIDNAESARAMLGKLDTALDKVNGNRAVMGAVMNRLDYIMENLSNVSMNTSASRSQIEDADYAKASTELARTQIMQQAATAVLAQANMDQQTVLKLLQ